MQVGVSRCSFFDNIHEEPITFSAYGHHPPECVLRFTPGQASDGIPRSVPLNKVADADGSKGWIQSALDDGEQVLFIGAGMGCDAPEQGERWKKISKIADEAINEAQSLKHLSIHLVVRCVASSNLTGSFIVAGTTSSSAIMISAPRRFCICMDSSGVSSRRLPSTGDWKVTPSSVISAK